LQAAVDKAVATFGGIDILVNNASAIALTGTEATSMKSYDLMHQINSRGTFLASKLCLPHLRKADNPHILNLSPPLNMTPHWFGRHVAYTMAKYGMSLCVLGMADEYRGKVAVNALWPKTVINTAAVQNQLGGVPAVQAARQPSIMADAAHAILSRPMASASGQFFIDEEILRETGTTDFSPYRVDPTLEDNQLLPDFFLD
ncbi:MAG: SDR family oxidoreductase, partial [Alcanivorax sp.]